jgi:hypothetical protein
MCPRLVFAAAMALAATTMSGGTIAGDGDPVTAVPTDAQSVPSPPASDWRTRGALVDDLGSITLGTQPAWQSADLQQGSWGVASLVIGPALPTLDSNGGAPASTQPVQPGATHPAMAVIPLAASYHVNQSQRITVAYGMASANTGSNNWRHDYTNPSFWTFTPKVAFAQVMPSADRQSATVIGVNVFPTSSSQMYENTAVGRVEAMVMRQTSAGWGFGGVAAAIEQFSQDPGTPSRGPPSLQSNDGMGLGVGPQVTWDTRWLGGAVQLRYRWIYELHGPGGHTIQPMLLSASVQL